MRQSYGSRQLLSLDAPILGRDAWAEGGLFAVIYGDR
jgi:hypothetical protein